MSDKCLRLLFTLYLISFTCSPVSLFFPISCHYNKYLFTGSGKRCKLPRMALVTENAEISDFGNRNAHMAFNFNYLFENEGLLKVTAR